MKKIRFLLILLCFCMLLPLVACGDDKTDDTVKDKYEYDDSCRELAADSIPSDYDLENQTIGILYTTGELATLGDVESTDIIYSRIYERNQSVQERLNVKIDFMYSGISTGWKDNSEYLRREIASMSDA